MAILEFSYSENKDLEKDNCKHKIIFAWFENGERIEEGGTFLWDKKNVAFEWNCKPLVVTTNCF